MRSPGPTECSSRRWLLQFFRRRVVRLCVISSQSSPVGVDQLLEESRLTQLNVLSLLAQAGHAYHNGNEQRAALLFGRP